MRWPISWPGSAVPGRYPPRRASAELCQEAHEVAVDFPGRFFVTEMSYATDGYVSAVRRVTPRSLNRVDQHIGVFVAAQMQQRYAERPAVQCRHESSPLAAKLAANQPSLVLQRAMRRRRNLDRSAQISDGFGEIAAPLPFLAGATADQAFDLGPVVPGQYVLRPDRHLVAQQRRQQRPALITSAQCGGAQRRRMR